MFDPDYRKSPWNHSRFAPKNMGTKGKTGKGNGITILSFIIALLLSSPVWYLTYTVSTQYIMATLIGSLMLWLIVAIIIRRREYTRLTDSDIKKKVYEQPARPVTVSASDMPPSLREIDNSRLEPSVFEEEIAWLITATTGHRTQVVGGSGDQGIDVEVFNKSGNRIGIVQCKRYDPSRPLPPNHIRELYAVKHRFRVPTAYLATTSYFSDSTRREARELGIRLMDGKTIRRMQKKAHSGLFEQRNSL